MLGLAEKLAGSPSFRLLGSAEIGSSQAPVGAPKPRQLLSLLLMNAGNLVSSDAVIDEIWSDRPPPSAVVTMQTYVLQVRRLLCRAGLADGDGKQTLVSRSFGYVLAVNPDDLDVEIFLHRARTARVLQRGGDLEATRKLLLDALALWRGPALTDVPVGPRLSSEIVRLDEERLVSIELLNDLELRAGRPHEILGDLSKLVSENRLHERLCGQLMLALYRCGRRAQALETYHRTRAVLVDQLGLDPSPMLMGLQRSMLSAEEELMDIHRTPWGLGPCSG